MDCEIAELRKNHSIGLDGRMKGWMDEMSESGVEVESFH